MVLKEDGDAARNTARNAGSLGLVRSRQILRIISKSPQWDFLLDWMWWCEQKRGVKQGCRVRGLTS